MANSKRNNDNETGTQRTEGNGNEITNGDINNAEGVVEMDSETNENGVLRPRTCFSLRNTKLETVTWKRLDMSLKSEGKSLSDKFSRNSAELKKWLATVGKKLDDPCDVEEWTSLFEKNFDKNRNKKCMSLAIALAKTEPDFFDIAEWIGPYLTANDDLCAAWGAAQTILGSLWKKQAEFVFDKRRYRKELTNHGIFYIGICEIFYEQFDQEGIFREDECSLKAVEERCRELAEKSLCRLNSVKDWEFVVWSLLYNSEQLATSLKVNLDRLVGKLMRTPPECFDMLNMTSNEKIRANCITIAWAATFNILGPGWCRQANAMINNKINQGSALIVDPPASKVINQAEQKQNEGSEIQKQNDDIDKNSVVEEQEKEGISENLNDEGSKKDANQKEKEIEPTVITPTRKGDGDHEKESNRPQSILRNGNSGEKQKEVSYKENRKTRQKLFLSKPKPKKSDSNRNLLNSLHGRQCVTFFKVKLPTWINIHNTPQSDTEVADKFSDMAQIIFSLDSKALILPWANESKAKPLTKSYSTVASKNSANLYCDNLYIKKDFSSWIRIKIAHDRDSKDLWDEEETRQKFKEMDMFGSKDRLQAHKTACAGWLLGSHQSTDCRSLEEALKLHYLLKDYELEVRFQPIKLDNRQKVPFAKLVKACHVHTDYNTIPQVRSILNSIYGNSNSNGDYPLGKNMRFIPHVADSRLRPSQATVNRASKCVTKQRTFLSKVITHITSAIEGLDYVEPSIGISIREACMRIQRSDKTEPTSMFVAIDEMYNGQVSFLFKQEVQGQARSIIQTLPVILEAEYGDAAYNWFIEGTKDAMEGYYWDDEEKMVRNEEDESTTDNQKWAYDDESITDDEEEGYEMEAMVENFKVILAQEVPISQQYSSGASVTTFRSTCKARGLDNNRPGVFDKVVSFDEVGKTKDLPIELIQDNAYDSQQDSSITEESGKDMQLFRKFQELLRNNPDMIEQLTKGGSGTHRLDEAIHKDHEDRTVVTNDLTSVGSDNDQEKNCNRTAASANRSGESE